MFLAITQLISQALHKGRQQDAEMRQLRLQVNSRIGQPVQSGQTGDSVIRMFAWARRFYVVCGSAAMLACGVGFWWWAGRTLAGMNSFWNSDPAASYSILIGLESARFAGFLAGPPLGFAIVVPFLYIGFRRQRELDAAWRKEGQWLREELGLPPERDDKAPSAAAEVRCSPGQLRLSILRQAVINSFLMLPAAGRVLFDEAIESSASTFLQQLA